MVEGGANCERLAIKVTSEVLAYLKTVQRTDAHSIRYIGKDMLDVADFYLFFSTYSLDLEP